MRHALRSLGAMGLAAFLAACSPPLHAPDPVTFRIQGEWPAAEAETQADGSSGWHLDRTGAGPDALQAQPYADQVVVAIVDTGVDPNHPELRSHLLPLVDLVGSDVYSKGGQRVEYAGRDGNGHGTHVAGLVVETAGARNPVWVLPVKAISQSGVGDDATIAKGIRFAADWRDPAHPERRVRVINLSIGGKTSSKVLEDALAYATARDVLVVVAAGNRERDVDYPAALPTALAVSATNRTDGLSSYSNRGRTVGISAPGGDDDSSIESTWPTYLTSTDLAHGTSSPHLRHGMMGTSMAAPQVSAAAAVVTAQDPYLSAAQVRSRLAAWSVDLGPPGPDGWFGVGRLSITNALAKGGHDAR